MMSFTIMLLAAVAIILTATQILFTPINGITATRVRLAPRDQFHAVDEASVISLNGEVVTLDGAYKSHHLGPNSSPLESNSRSETASAMAPPLLPTQVSLANKPLPLGNLKRLSIHKRRSSVELEREQSLARDSKIQEDGNWLFGFLGNMAKMAMVVGIVTLGVVYPLVSFAFLLGLVILSWGQ